ncbi:transporter substrate-binding domain-containing protein [Pseudomonas sp. SA3-5]|uniref:Transporter substrate-binding domain-containing protein n=1 Tax=Pseudomonas aestuarii TaxID=3018340 RepID=A0ABT4XJZ3_9PSED|nr:transporter substrate-binding domain-containing protein [Pseudomonas aestuarii]MDA7088438.1 transporter substrate-binding domain-containing protein [Pseudomonas aestuarii]
MAQAECSRDIVVPFSDVGVDLNATGGQRGGISVDYLDEVSQRTGCHFVYVDVPRARAWYMLAHQQADVVPAAIRTGWRDDSGVFYDQFVQEGVSLLSMKERPQRLNSMEAILHSGLTFTFVRGHDYGPRTAELIELLEAQGQLRLVKDPGIMLRMLQAGRIDAAIVMASIVTTEAAALGLNDTLHGEPIEDLEWGSTGIYLSNSTLLPADAKLLASTFEQLNDEGFYVQGYQQLQANMPPWVTTGFRYGRKHK